MNAYVYRALVVYSNATTGEIRVKIPSLIGIQSDVPISYIGRSSSNDLWAVPKIGEQIVVTADDTNLTNVFWLQVEPFNPGTHEPTGFSNKNESVISFDTATRTFTIAPVIDNFEVWVRGIKYTISTELSIVLPVTRGGYNIYFDTAGNLQYKTTFFDLEWDAPVAYIYWTGSQDIVFADERHGTTMDWQTHEYFHRTQGAQYASGFGLTVTSTTGTGSLATDMQVNVANGTFFDEDLQVDISHASSPTPDTWQQRLQNGAYIPVFYHLSTGWEKTTATQYPVKFGTTYPQYNSDASTLVDMGANRYGIAWILATNNLNEPIVSIMGQFEHSNIAKAQAEKWSGLTIPSFPMYETRPLWKVIFQAVSGTVVKAAIREIEDIRTSVKSTTGASSVEIVNYASDQAILASQIFG